MSLPVGLGLWRLLTWALSPLARPYLRQRASRGSSGAGSNQGWRLGGAMSRVP